MKLEKAKNNSLLMEINENKDYPKDYEITVAIVE